jgi:hypothetical protein
MVRKVLLDDRRHPWIQRGVRHFGAVLIVVDPKVLQRVIK